MSRLVHDGLSEGVFKAENAKAVGNEKFQAGGFADALGIAPDENNPLNPLGALRFGFEQVKRETFKNTRAGEARGGGSTAKGGG